MEYSVIRSDRRSSAVEIKNYKVIIRVPKHYTDAMIEAVVQKNRKWIETHLAKVENERKRAESQPKLTEKELLELIESAKVVIPKRVEYFSSVIGVTYNRVSIRYLRTQWGSCSSRGNLSFNYMLMLAPPEVLDSVIVHELCHRKQMNHSEKFYAEVMRVFPDYPKANQWLHENGNILMTRLETEE